MTVRDLLYGLSLANVIMLRAWFIAGGSAYFNAHLPLHLAYVGLSLDFGLLGLVLAGLFAWSRRSVTGRRVAATILALLLLVPLETYVLSKAAITAVVTVSGVLLSTWWFTRAVRTPDAEAVAPVPAAA